VVNKLHQLKDSVGLLLFWIHCFLGHYIFLYFDDDNPAHTKAVIIHFECFRTFVVVDDMYSSIRNRRGSDV